MWVYKLLDSCSISRGALLCFLVNLHNFYVCRILLYVKKQLLNLTKQLLFSTEKHRWESKFLHLRRLIYSFTRYTCTVYLARAVYVHTAQHLEPKYCTYRTEETGYKCAYSQYLRLEEHNLFITLHFMSDAVAYRRAHSVLFQLFLPHSTNIINNREFQRVLNCL